MPRGEAARGTPPWRADAYAACRAADGDMTALGRTLHHAQLAAQYVTIHPGLLVHSPRAASAWQKSGCRSVHEESRVAKGKAAPPPPTSPRHVEFCTEWNTCTRLAILPEGRIHSIT